MKRGKQGTAPWHNKPKPVKVSPVLPIARKTINVLVNKSLQAFAVEVVTNNGGERAIDCSILAMQDAGRLVNIPRFFEGPCVQIRERMLGIFENQRSYVQNMVAASFLRHVSPDMDAPLTELRQQQMRDQIMRKTLTAEAVRMYALMMHPRAANIVFFTENYDGPYAGYFTPFVATTPLSPDLPFVFIANYPRGHHFEALVPDRALTAALIQVELHPTDLIPAAEQDEFERAVKASLEIYEVSQAERAGVEEAIKNSLESHRQETVGPAFMNTFEWQSHGAAFTKGRSLQEVDTKLQTVTSQYERQAAKLETLEQRFRQLELMYPLPATVATLQAVDQKVQDVTAEYETRAGRLARIEQRLLQMQMEEDSLVAEQLQAEFDAELQQGQADAQLARRDDSRRSPWE